MSESGPILFYDGVCALCNGAVTFVLKRDRSRAVRFAALQGDTAKAYRASHPGLDGVDSMIWAGDGGAPLIRSDAAIAIGRHVGGVWGVMASIARVVPRFLRDTVYDFIARIRYRTFGKYDACPIPPPEHRGRFLP
ncbi:MAG TPA: DCC1-like thiol-disulfide oxidoreductase family protein [Candidatus Polarisedimenticolaceae bacterium]|nr:DCC1-like thiol-disulfide oxidoreductase family protein [Candidatus Polarisedimenticolaceae bacterium]